MVIAVKLEGLNVVQSRGKWYVYHRDSKKTILKGFVGTRAELERRLSQDDTMATYQAVRKRALTKTYAAGTLGALIQWYENDCPEYARLSEATKKDYRAAFLYMAPAWPAPLDSFTQPELYDLRDRCAKDKNPRFADKMISALSSMFSRAVKRGKIATNPAKGIEKAHKADPNANREWTEAEWLAVVKEAPVHLLTPMMIARYAGFRGQTIAALQWSQYQDDSRTGKCFRVVARKNEEPTWIPVLPELRAYLDSLTRTAVYIATRTDGTPWQGEVQMQTEVSHFLRGLEKAGKIGENTTLHGLRVTYAADLRRNGADTGDVAAALGDRSERMGAHYTRHVENEARVIRAFKGKNKG